MAATVRLEPDPAKTMLLLGTNAGSDELPDTVRLLAAVSASLTVKASVVRVPALMV